MILERNFNFPTTRMRNSGKNWTEGMRMYPMNINLISYTRCIVQIWRIFFHPVYTSVYTYTYMLYRYQPGMCAPPRPAGKQAAPQKTC